jgi:mannosyl-oligosaccharide alpha-1,2-mannosidase
MLHFRRYRYFVLTAAIVVFLLYRSSLNSEAWDSFTATVPNVPQSQPEHGTSTKEPPRFDESATIEKVKSVPEEAAKPRPAVVDPSTNTDTVADQITIPDLKNNAGASHDSTAITTTDDDDDEDEDSRDSSKQPSKSSKPSKQQSNAYDAGDDDADDSTPAYKDSSEIDIPDRKIKPVGVQAGGVGLDGEKKTTTTTTSKTEHWTKVPEHFPVPTESIITLPTGKPEKVPKVQAEFKPESAEAKDKRLGRLAKVKAEMTRAWSGYKEYAWLHDEIRPVTKSFRDPFCGWAATLVDGLDTLWIMGMKDEFEDAVEAIKTIDFTTSERAEIPVFETTIRYLGGLVAAYDVSGGKAGGYTVLLDKAVELAEILMGVFDTPNRMPVLYYGWKPASASRPKRASSYANLAELGSLSMEFTRLAQLTKEDKYYDAVARITDALYEWQNRGTVVPGIFDDRVDASGCNRTAEAELASQKAAELIKQSDQDSDSSSDKGFGDKTTSGTGYRGPDHDLDGSSSASKESDLHDLKSLPVPRVSKRAIQSDDDDEDSDPADNLISPTSVWDIDALAQKECIPQGLTESPGMGSYAMGGGQDSTYEYFPKEYLLLAGLEPKLRTMYLKTVEGVKEHLLYRPMVPDDRDLLFSANIKTRETFDEDAQVDYEITHLTCFLGGMFGLGGMIFNQPVDVEIGKKLTDACIWAYEAMPSGIMPEGATAVPCENTKNCVWNETLWWEYLDPLADMRDAQLADYYARQDALESQQAQTLLDGRLTEEAGEKIASSTGQDRSAKNHIAGQGDAGWGDSKDDSTSSTPQKDKFHTTSSSKWSEDTYDDSTRSDEDGNTSDLRSGSLTGKRDLGTDSEPGTDSTKSQRATPPPAEKNSDRSKLSSAAFMDETPTYSNLDDVLDMNGGGSTTQTKPLPHNVQVVGGSSFEPTRPLSHKEFVMNRLENEKIPPGFASVNFRNYILRPEAIESVWYMWRITGDTYWQEKGWKMFEAIVRHTQTEAGASAIDNVMSSYPDKEDSMESFWVGETLKYFYLLYSEPDVISLDEWVLNTEAHPFKRPA